MTCTTYRQIFFLLTLLLHGAHNTLCEMVPATRLPVPCELKPFANNTLVVTSNADDINDPTTLRGALAVAQAGDVITFDLPVGFDEIILNSNSPLVVDTTVVIDGTNLAGSGTGEERITINGDFSGDGIGDTNICFIVESTAPVTTIKNIIIKQFNGHDLMVGSGSANAELPAYGILIEEGAIGCTITNCVIQDIISGENQNAAGIFSETDTCPITDNTIANISSISPDGSEAINSGHVWGIRVEGSISGNCSGNIVFNITSGSSNANSGRARGIDVDHLDGSLFNNRVFQVDSGNAPLGQSGETIGIRVGLIRGVCTNNNITQLMSGVAEDRSGIVSGLQSAVIQGECAENVIYDLASGITTATGAANIRSGDVYGILSGNTFHNDIRNNSICLLQSGTSYESGNITGVISSVNIVGSFTNNLITGLFSGLAVSKSGDVSGVLINNIQGSFSCNSIGIPCADNVLIEGLASGIAEETSGLVFGYVFENNLGEIKDNIVTNLASGNAGITAGNVFGINGGSAFNDCAQNSVTFLSSGNIEPAGSNVGVATSGEVTGIVITNVSGTCIDNFLADLSSGAALGVNDSSGNVTGIEFETLLGRLWSNIVLRLSSGPADLISGDIVGIKVGTYLRGDAANNTVQFVMAGDASTIGYVRGIWLTAVQYDRLIACNCVDQMRGGNDGEDSFGLAIEMGDRLSICQNKITNVTGTDSTVMHGMLFGNENAGRMLTNSDITNNFIQTVLGGNNTNGFGITIVNQNSLGNQILNNNIFDINGKAINIVDNNVETDAGTIVTAPIILNWVICPGNGTIRIDGDLFPHPDFDEEEFLLQFFVSDLSTPPQAMIFIGKETVEANGSPTSFTIELKPTKPIFEEQFITATATALVDPNKNTSEVSPSLAGCNSARQTCFISMIDCIEPPEPCPISLENAPPLEPPCSATPCGPCPCL